MRRAPISELRGGGPAANAAILGGILAGNIRGSKRYLAITNAADAFEVAGLANYMASGIELAREQIDSGRALEKLRALQNYDAKVSV
jgi:anthranilate phosphoribosyltransferase